MWQRRSIAEISRNDRKKQFARFSPFGPLLFSAFCAIFLTAAKWGGSRGKGFPWAEPIPFSEALPYLPWYFISIFIFAYIFHVFGFKLVDSATSICDSCHEVTGHISGSSCSCGGHLEPFENWQWIKKAEQDDGANDPQRG
jgi:hypothetical protein